MLIMWVLFTPDFGLTQGVIFGFCLDHEVFKVHVLIFVTGKCLKVTNVMKEVLIGAGLVGGEKCCSDAITLNSASIACDCEHL